MILKIRSSFDEDYPVEYQYDYFRVNDVQKFCVKSFKQDDNLESKKDIKLEITLLSNVELYFWRSCIGDAVFDDLVSICEEFLRTGKVLYKGSALEDYSSNLPT